MSKFDKLKKSLRAVRKRFYAAKAVLWSGWVLTGYDEDWNNVYQPFEALLDSLKRTDKWASHEHLNTTAAALTELHDQLIYVQSFAWVHSQEDRTPDPSLDPEIAADDLHQRANVDIRVTVFFGLINELDELLKEISVHLVDRRV